MKIIITLLLMLVCVAGVIATYHHFVSHRFFVKKSLVEPNELVTKFETSKMWMGNPTFPDGDPSTDAAFSAGQVPRWLNRKE